MSCYQASAIKSNSTNELLEKNNTRLAINKTGLVYGLTKS